jgi:hypothetical protein
VFRFAGGARPFRTSSFVSKPECLEDGGAGSVRRGCLPRFEQAVLVDEFDRNRSSRPGRHELAGVGAPEDLVEPDLVPPCSDLGGKEGAKLCVYEAVHVAESERPTRTRERSEEAGIEERVCDRCSRSFCDQPVTLAGDGKVTLARQPVDTPVPSERLASGLCEESAANHLKGLRPEPAEIEGVLPLKPPASHGTRGKRQNDS